MQNIQTKEKMEELKKKMKATKQSKGVFYYSISFNFSNC